MALMTMYYNLARLHMILKFGKIAGTPAMQAGLVTKRLSLREIFGTFFLFSYIAVAARNEMSSKPPQTRSPIPIPEHAASAP
jgi:hypothetical protein